MLPTEYAGAVLSEVDGLVLIRALQHERSDMIALAVVAQCPWGPMQSEIAKRLSLIHISEPTRPY